MARTFILSLVTLSLALSGGCYYKAKHKRTKAHSSYLSEAEAESLIQKRMARHGVKFISNMKLKREGASFIADGYDRDVRVGFEYRSHEGMDFEDEADSSPAGLKDDEIEALRDRQDTFREFFLIVPEGPADTVEEAVAEFVKMLYEKEVLKRKKVKKSDSLFPDEKKAKKRGDALPWEATGDLKKKREEMERKEKQRNSSDGDEDDFDNDWQGDDDDEDSPDEGKDEPEKKKPSKKPEPVEKDDGWGDDDEDF